EIRQNLGKPEHPGRIVDFKDDGMPRQTQDTGAKFHSLARFGRHQAFVYLGVCHCRRRMFGLLTSWRSRNAGLRVPEHRGLCSKTNVRNCALTIYASARIAEKRLCE